MNLVKKSKVRRIILLTLGWEELPKSVSVYGAPEDQRLREPVPGVLLQTDRGLGAARHRVQHGPGP